MCMMYDSLSLTHSLDYPLLPISQFGFFFLGDVWLTLLASILRFKLPAASHQSIRIFFYIFCNTKLMHPLVILVSYKVLSLALTSPIFLLSNFSINLSTFFFFCTQLNESLSDNLWAWARTPSLFASILDVAHHWVSHPFLVGYPKPHWFLYVFSHLLDAQGLLYINTPCYFLLRLHPAGFTMFLS